MPFDPEAARKLAGQQSPEERRAEERRVEERLSEERRITGPPASRYGNESTFSTPAGNVPPSYAGSPMGNVRLNDSGVPGGYAPGNSLRPGG